MSTIRSPIFLLAFPNAFPIRLSARLLLGWAAPVAAQDGQADAGPAGITGVELRREGERLDVVFQLSRETPYEVVSNVAQRVVVVKFRDARPALPSAQNALAFNHPLLVGIAFEQVGERDTWAKLRLRTDALGVEARTPSPAGRVVLALNRAEAPPAGLQLRAVRLSEREEGARLVLDLSGIPQVQQERSGGELRLRLQGVTPRLSAPVQAENPIVAVRQVAEAEGDTVVTLALRRPGVRVNRFELDGPPRLVVDLLTGPTVAEEAETEGEAPRAPETAQAPSQAVALQSLLEAEEDPRVRATYQLAEREFRAGNYQRAGTLFMRVYNAARERPLGVRAYFRAADAQYELQVQAGSERFHGVITTYQAAIRAAEDVGYQSALIPRAFFQIGRSYQRMGFHSESNVHYQILQDRYPEAVPYTADSYFYAGLNHVQRGSHEAAVAALRTFLGTETGDPGLIGPAYYNLGDALFSLERFVEARQAFDVARDEAPDFPDSRPLLLFHLGETYYENADFEQARVYYRQLLEDYPERDFTKLVALRMGDFLRDQGREEEALQTYQRIVDDAPLALRLRGKMRIANLLAARPTGQDFQRAVALYDEVIDEGRERTVVEEAVLRKALTLTRHGRHHDAIAAFERLREDYPDSRFNRPNIVQASIEENLVRLVDRHFANKEHWEVAKVFARYQDYFSGMDAPLAMFQVGRAYQHLGLYDEALVRYDRLLADEPGTLAGLAAYQRARTFVEQDDLGQAEEALLSFIQERAESDYRVDARMLLGQVYTDARRYEDALNAYRILVRAFEENPDDPVLGEAMAQVHFRLGQLHKELGQHQEALQAFREAVARFNHPLQGEQVPDYIALSHFSQGDMLYELGQYREAIGAYEDAAALYPEHDQAPWARYQTGLAQRQLGRDREALETFNQLVELAEVRPGELWAPLARENQRDLMNKLDFQDYLQQ